MLYNALGSIERESISVRELEERIVSEGVVLPGGVLKVDSFLNHQMDPMLFTNMAKEFLAVFGGDKISKILTIEASGIGLACITGQVFGCPVVFAKKSRSKTLETSFYNVPVHSFTHGTTSNILVSRAYLKSSDRVLIVDDFLANGAALKGLIALCEQAGATVAGIGVAIEKAFQNGGKLIRSEGYKLVSLAKISEMSPESGVSFCD